MAILERWRQITVETKSAFRVYVTQTQEIFELLDSGTNTVLRWVFHYGESLSFFVEDWEKEDEQIIKQIMEYINQGTEYMMMTIQRVENPFLCLLCMNLTSQLQSEYSWQSEITDFCAQLQKAREDARILLTECLCEKTQSLYARYRALWKDKPPCLEHVCIMPIPADPLNDSGDQPATLLVANPEFICCDRKMPFCEICYPENVLTLYDYLKSVYLRRAVQFKRCRLCGKLFAAVDGTRTKYCSRKYSGNKVCRDIGASRVYQKKILSDPITRAYNRAYKTHNARIRYGTMTKEEFRTWVAEAKHLRDACLSGNITLDGFMDWLKQ